MSDFHGHDYNYAVSPHLKETHTELRSIFPTGSPAGDFTLPRLDGEGEVTLSELRGKPVLIEFGSIT